MTLIQQFEGCNIEAYKCPSGVWTIGYGNTRYENGNRVQPGDVITQKRAEQLFNHFHKEFETQVKKLVKTEINVNQLDALTSFAYNVGIGNLGRSTLLKKVNANPNDSTIADEFRKWVRSGGKVMKGLQRRREAEIAVYFRKTNSKK